MSELLRKGKGKFIFLVGIAGILLIYLSSVLGGDRTEKAVTADSSREYCEQLKSETEELVKGITGSKRVSVVITLDSGKQYVYADEGKTVKSDTDDDREKSYTIIRSSDGDENGLLITEYMPTVRGVAIVCESLSAEGEERVRSAVSAALDISSKRIYITSYTN